MFIFLEAEAPEAGFEMAVFSRWRSRCYSLHACGSWAVVQHVYLRSDRGIRGRLRDGGVFPV